MGITPTYLLAPSSVHIINMGSPNMNVVNSLIGIITSYTMTVLYTRLNPVLLLVGKTLVTARPATYLYVVQHV